MQYDNTKVFSNEVITQLLSGLPLNQGKLDLSDRAFALTMKGLEKSHWHYLDNVCHDYWLRTPRLNFYKFLQQIFNKLCPEEIPQIKNYIRKYDRYKKSLPTAGGLIIHTDINNIDHILTIKTVGSHVFALPKGKAENNETMQQTAIREIKEETGLDLSWLINEKTTKINVHKTVLFVVRADQKIKHFSDYNHNEIVDIRWFSIEEIRQQPNRFSKQLKATIEKMQQLEML